jgi:hypothetical protein
MSAFHPLRTFAPASIIGWMVDLLYLSPGGKMPEVADDEPWLIVEASDDGRFSGTVWGRKPSGEGVFYASSSGDDVSLEAAPNAAIKWAVSAASRASGCKQRPHKRMSVPPLRTWRVAKRLRPDQDLNPVGRHVE